MAALEVPPDELQLQWEQEQSELAARLIEEDDIGGVHKWDEGGLKLIGGVDISFVKNSETDACASLVVLDFPTLEVVYSKFEMVKLTVPYIR